MTTGLRDDAVDPLDQTAGPVAATGGGPAAASGGGLVAPVAGDIAGAPAVTGRNRSSGRLLTVQSKLLIMLLGASILSTLVVGYIGYRSGTEALRDSAFERMTEVRESRTREITQLFTNLEDSQVIFTRGTTVIDAARDFTAGFEDLQTADITPAQDAAVETYYTDVFATGLTERTGRTVEPAGVLPDSPAQRYLQAIYTAPFDDFDDAIALDDAGDGSDWSAAHALYHDYFRELTLRGDYEDALLLDTEGNVVYSAYKGVDLGTNVRTGPFRGASLQTAYDEAIRSNDVDVVVITDFALYQPSYDVPTMWAVSPVGPSGEIVGALALQLPISTINQVMTGDEGWADDGLGQTGETYLVGGADQQMRSVSRQLLEDPEQFRADVVGAGTPPEDADMMVAVRGSILLLTVETDAAERGVRGQAGTVVTRDYRDHEVLAAYAPLPVGDLNWAVVAQIDTDEAFAPTRDFARSLAITIAAIVLLVSVAALLMAQVFARPLGRLVQGVRRIAAGDLDTRVPPSSTEEFNDLGTAFNEMGSSLRTKADLIEEQQREYDRMLLTMMPEAVARRYRGGEETIAEDHSNVSVVFADVVGFDEFAADLTSDQSLALLNGLVRSFDEAAERQGVERVRTLRRGYLASCGMVTPRIDHARRAVDFAREMQETIERFNAQHGSDLGLRAGIDTGTVTSGLVGRASVMYDMWGDAVNLAYRVQGAGGQAGVFVTARVYDRLRGSGYAFEAAGPIETQSGSQPVWLLQPRIADAS